VSKEPYLPIDRTKLSKALLTELNKLQWRDAEFFKSAGVDFITGEEASDVDFKGKKVSLKKSGKTLGYDKLILSTGGTPRKLPLEGFDASNVFVLRTQVHAKEINAALGDYKDKKVAIIGTSFIGMELANCLAGKGAKVTLIGIEKAPL